MAMIMCPECGQKVSDKAGKCVHCGYPLVKERTTSKKIIIGMVVFVLVIVMALGCMAGWNTYNEEIKPKNIYNKAKELIEVGKYEEADELLTSIKGYEDADMLQVQIRYESYVCECVDMWKEQLKNPDAFTLDDVEFYFDQGAHGMYSHLSLMGEVDYSYPAIIFRSSSQNENGENLTEYELFYFVKDEGYTCMGSCDSLSEYDYYDSDGQVKDKENGTMKVMLCTEMKELKEKAILIDVIDKDRLKTVLEKGGYSIIKTVQ